MHIGGGDQTEMKTVKLLHAADLHLDSPFEGLSEDKAVQRRREQRELLRSLSQTAKSEGAQLVLLSGDLLDSDSTYLETSEELLRALEDMAVPVFIAPGNHDPYTAASPYARLSFPDNVHIFKGRPECVDLPELGVRVFGAGFTDRYSASLLQGFRCEKRADRLDLMCIHGELNPASSYNPISEAIIAESNMDYIALGHIHKGSGLKKSGNTYYAWPGCTEGRGFDETGEKQVYVVELSEDACSIKPICIAKRRYEILRLSPSEDVLAAVNAVLPHNAENDIYRLILEGETSVPPSVTALYDALADRFFALQIRDRTTMKRDVWENAGDDSLRGRFLLELKMKFDAAVDDDERAKITQAARWGLAALDKREEAVCHDNK